MWRCCERCAFKCCAMLKRCSVVVHQGGIVDHRVVFASGCSIAVDTVENLFVLRVVASCVAGSWKLVLAVPTKFAER
eukprot:1667561-Amphidinium_carterae.1